MANFNGNNYAKAYVSTSSGSGKYALGEYNGHVKVLYDEITFAAEITTSDVVRIGKLPRLARVLDVRLKGEAMSAGTFSVGHTGYVAAPWNSNVAKAAAAAGFLAATSFASANQADGAGVDIGAKFLSETEVQVACTVNSTAATGKKLQCWVKYIVE